MKPLRECKDCNRVSHTEDGLLFFVKNKKCKYGRLNLCKKCAYKRQAKIMYGNEHIVGVSRLPKNTFRNHADVHRHTKYRILPHEYDAMIKYSENKCQICKCSPDHKRNNGHKVLSVDHCHATGKVRGLLCMSCNTSLGRMDDSIMLLQNSIEYLEHNSSGFL